jgi:glycosyltransferase involved in cell wall biosynthesis
VAVVSGTANPLVSIIIPCYNAEQWLAQAVACCVNQTYRPLEIIIIDDGSTDGSLQQIHQLAQQHPDLIRYETGANRGGCAARNRGTELAQGEFLLFFDADDLLEPETIAGEIETLAERTDVIAACPWWSIEWDGVAWQRFDHRYAQVSDPLFGELKYGDYLPAPALLWHRSILAALGGWDETLWANQDGDLRLRARLSGYEFVYSARGGFIYRRHSINSISGSTSARALESRIRVLEKVEAELIATNRLEMYRVALSCGFHTLAYKTLSYNEPLADRALSHARRLGGLRSVHGTFKHRLLCYTIGLKRKERLANSLMQGAFASLLSRTRKLKSLTEYAPKS